MNVTIHVLYFLTTTLLTTRNHQSNSLFFFQTETYCVKENLKKKLKKEKMKALLILSFPDNSDGAQTWILHSSFPQHQRTESSQVWTLCNAAPAEYTTLGTYTHLNNTMITDVLLQTTD